jgi:hypothetical protein
MANFLRHLATINYRTASRIFSISKSDSGELSIPSISASSKWLRLEKTPDAGQPSRLVERLSSSVDAWIVKAALRASSE